MSNYEEDLWWKKEIPRLQVELKKLEFDLARVTYGPAANKIKNRMTVLQVELDNALLVAQVYAQGRKTHSAGPWGGASPETAIGVEAKPRKPQRCNPEVAKRRALVKANPGIDAEEICEIFDREGVPLPSKWLEAGFKIWCVAYKRPGYRAKIDVLISKDRRRN
jgi:hypothetical protein